MTAAADHHDISRKGVSRWCHLQEITAGEPGPRTDDPRWRSVVADKLPARHGDRPIGGGEIGTAIRRARAGSMAQACSASWTPVTQSGPTERAGREPEGRHEGHQQPDRGDHDREPLTS